MNPLSPLNPVGPLPATTPARTAPPAPQQAPRPDAFTQTTLQPEPPRATPHARRPRLIHPGTPQEFREQLEPLLERLPPGLVQGIADQGYTLHVLGEHPLTLDPEPPDPGTEERVWTTSRSLREIATETGARLEDLRACNPHLPLLPDCPGETPVPAGEPLLVPETRYWGAAPVRATAWEFLTQPRRSFMAGLVTHGLLPGFRHAENRILLWDLVFRDPLRDWYVLHELGHTADFAFAFRQPEAWREWRSRLAEAHARDRAPFTRYAGESPTEYFAEGFAAWATPEPSLQSAAGDLARQRLAMSRGELRRRAPELCALIEEAAL